jgi:hypothetical protein
MYSHKSTKTGKKIYKYTIIKFLHLKWSGIISLKGKLWQGKDIYYKPYSAITKIVKANKSTNKIKWKHKISRIKI